MSTPVSSAHTDDTVPVRPSPLVKRVFGEPRFHADGDIAGIAFAADGTLYSIDEGGVLRHWTADGKLLGRHFLSDLETLWCFNPTATVLASGNDDLILWDANSGQLLSRIEQPSGPEAWVTALAFSADGRTVASGHDDGKVRFWDVGSQKFLGEIQAHPTSPIKRPVSALAFSPNGAFLATAGEDLAVRVWDADSHKLVAELKSHTDRVPSLTWSPDSKTLISAGWDTSARVWRPPHLDPLMLLNSHADQVTVVAYSPDGKYLACADSDNDIHLWLDAEAATRGPVLRGHSDEVRCLTFSPDGTKLASAGADRVVHVWDVRDGKLLAGPNPKGRHAIAVIPVRLFASRVPAAPEHACLGCEHRRRGGPNESMLRVLGRCQPGRQVAGHRRHRLLHPTVERAGRRARGIARSDQAAGWVRHVHPGLKDARSHQPRGRSCVALDV